MYYHAQFIVGSFSCGGCIGCALQNSLSTPLIFMLATLITCGGNLLPNFRLRIQSLHAEIKR